MTKRLPDKQRPTPAKPPKGGPRTFGRLQRALDETARREIAAALSESGGNISETARLLGISRRGLWKRMSTLGIAPDDHRG
jgi:DNA-binding NtrC family response regulator